VGERETLRANLLDRSGGGWLLLFWQGLFSLGTLYHQTNRLGGMDTVFKTYQSSMDRYVAPKILSIHLI
jgi:hypothetical protein